MLKSILASLSVAIVFIAAFASTDAAGLSVVGAWLFEEGSGDEVMDLSGNNNNGTLGAGVTWTDGKFGKGLEFDGSGDAYIDVPYSTSLALTDSWTLTAWVYMKGNNAKNANIFLVAKGMPSNNYCIWIKNDDKSAMVEFYDGGYHGIGSATKIELNKWHHIAGTYDGASIKVYLDGKLENSLDYEGASNVNDGSLVIGSSGHTPLPNGFSFNGVMDEVLVVEGVLNESDIQLAMSGIENAVDLLGITQVDRAGKLPVTWGNIKAVY